MGFRRKHDTAGCKQLDLGCTLAQLLARSLAHLIDAISNHRHDGEGADMTAWVNVFIRRAEIRTPARLRQRQSKKVLVLLWSPRPQPLKKASRSWLIRPVWVETKAVRR